MIIRQANTILVAERERYSVLVVFLLLFFTPAFSKEWNSVFNKTWQQVKYVV